MTNQTSNGQTDLNPFDVQRIDGLLDEYEKKVGLPSVNFEKLEPIDSYLTMTRESLDKLAPQDCAEISFILKQHALYIQREQNRQQSRISYAKGMINQVIADEQSGYSGSWESTREQAIKHNDVAVKLNKIMIYATMRYDRLAFLSKAIVGLADTLVHIQFTKKGNMNG